MPRLHLFEFNERRRFPRSLRDAMTGYLDTVSRVTGLNDGLVPELQRALEQSGADRIVDLCSGSGATVAEISRRVDAPPPVVLTDRFPNRRAFALHSDERVRGWTDPVDARSVPDALGGLRTIFNGFHQFERDDALAILRDARERREPILIVEISERTTVNVLLAPLIVPFVLLLMPLVRPRRWQQFVFTYLVPVIPLAVFWDGLVSHLRTYAPYELQHMLEELGEDPQYRWEVRQVRLVGNARATVLCGVRAADGSVL